MRSIAIGLAAVFAVAAIAPSTAFAAKEDKAAKAAVESSAKSHAQGMAEAPPIAQTLGLSCTPTDANFVGVSKEKKDGKEVSTKVYELVCSEGLGYMILAVEGGTAQGFDCLALAVNKPKQGEADKGALFCRLPPNANPVQGLQPIMTKAGKACTVAEARWMGSEATNKFNQYEVSCSEGAAYVLQVPERGSSHTLSALSCLTLTGGICQYMPQEKVLQVIAGVAASANRTACQPTDTRYMGTTAANQNSYFEVSCADGKSGYVLQMDPNNKFVAAIDCARASTIGGGCTLTTAVAAQTEELNTYNKLAKEIGYTCNVKAYHSFGLDTQTGREVVELACSDHPDSVIAMLPVDKGQKGEFFNCARAAAKNLKCSLSPIEATYAKISSQIQATGKSCKVNNARAVGVAANGSEYVEVTCVGEPGLMVEYAPGPETVKTSMACLTAKGIGGGCKLQ